MCGRYSLFASQGELETRFDVSVGSGFEPRYNATPGQKLPVITDENPGRLCRLEWGLVPRWADDATECHINARSETVSQKPAFADAYERRRCLVPADGFYEWVPTEEGKRPYRVAFDDDRPFAMAGLWERWEGTREQVGLDAFGGGGAADPDTEVKETFAIVTVEPNDLVADLHHRMAAILPHGREREWLRADDPDRRSELLEPHPDDELRAYPVSTAVNDPTNDGPELIESVAP